MNRPDSLHLPGALQLGISVPRLGINGRTISASAQ
jgi:hypothetical protein